MKVILVSLMAIVFLGCNNEAGDESPYREILSREPYAGITDSIRKNPGDDALYFRRAVLLNRNNLPEPALADFHKAWSLAPSEKYAFGVSNGLLEKKPDSAILFLEEALKEFPESYLLQISKARALVAVNRIDEAIMNCESIIAVHPGQAEVHVLLADLYEKKGDLGKATQAIESAYRMSPDLEKAFRLAFNFAQTKNPRTVAFCDSLMAADSPGLYAEPIYVKGIYYSNTGEPAKAIRAFEQTIVRDHNFLDAYIEKGKILLEQKKVAAALQSFELANTIRPSFPDAWFWIAKCQEALGQLELAKSNYQKAYSLDKSFVEAREAYERM